MRCGAQPAADASGGGVRGEGEWGWSAMNNNLFKSHIAYMSCDKSADVIVGHYTGMYAEPVPASNGATVHVYDPKKQGNKRIQPMASRGVESMSTFP